MIILLLALVLIFISYYLFIKGYLWKLIILGFGTFGMYYFLSNYVPGANTTIISILEMNLSWAICVPIIVVLLGLGTTKAE